MKRNRRIFMGRSKYFSPKSVAEAISLLSEYGEKAEIIAGGTDSLVRLKKGDTPPDLFINIGEIQELSYIQHDDKGGLRIGAGTPIHSIVNSSLLKEGLGILSHAAGKLGTPTIRRQATIGGNLCNAAPSGDMAPSLIVLGAQLKISGIEGDKSMLVEDFITGPGQTRLKRNEMLTEIHIPHPVSSGRAVYLKQTRSQGADLAIVGVAVMVVMDGEVIKDVKICLGAVAPTPLRAKKAEELLRGKKPDDKLLEACSKAATLESSPIDDVRSSAAYREKLIGVLVKRAIRKVIESEE
jgi:CO/xanthine dehydrogenase FAD-binding subunit